MTAALLIPSLRDAAPDGLLVGAAVQPRQLDDPEVAAMLARQYSTLTAENAMKPLALSGLDFAEADRLADFAAENGQKLVGHTLLWHQSTPEGMFADADGNPLPREEALKNLEDYITAVAGHFRGRVLGWDVVNEAIGDGEDFLRDTPARRAIGDDYLVHAFRFAAAADPEAELYYNDFHIEKPEKRAKTLRLLADLKAAGVRVDAVGIQGHWSLDWPPTETIDEAIAAYRDAGYEVMITELDVDVLPREHDSGGDIDARENAGLNPYVDGLPDDVQARLADRYAGLFALFARHAREGTVTRVTLWGTHDGHSWLNDFPVRGRTNHALLFDRDLEAKPAFHAAAGALSE